MDSPFQPCPTFFGLVEEFLQSLTALGRVTGPRYGSIYNCPTSWASWSCACPIWPSDVFLVNFPISREWPPVLIPPLLHRSLVFRCRDRSSSRVCRHPSTYLAWHRLTRAAFEISNPLHRPAFALGLPHHGGCSKDSDVRSYDVFGGTHFEP